MINGATLGLASKLAQSYLETIGFNFQHQDYVKKMVYETKRHYAILLKSRRELEESMKEKRKEE